MDLLNSFRTTKLFSSFLLALLLVSSNNGGLQFAKGQNIPFTCLFNCGVQLFTCSLPCGENLGCYTSCWTADFRCATACFVAIEAEISPVSPPIISTTLVGGRIAMGGDVKAAEAIISSSSSFYSSEKSIKGSLQFFQDYSNGGKSHIMGRIQGLTPGVHALHIYHWTTNSNATVAYDLGNIVAGPDGISEISIEQENVPLNGPSSLLGRAIVVRDANKTTGNAGAGAFGCGVIVIKSYF